MKNTVETRAIIAYLLKKLDQVKRIEDHHLSDKLLDKATDDLFACKTMAEALIGEPITVDTKEGIVIGNFTYRRRSR